MKKFLPAFVAVLCTYHIAQAQPTAGLVAYWRMDGNYTDAGPNSINGTNAGSTATTNSKNLSNTAMQFLNPGGSVPQYATHPINAAVNFSGTQNFTYSFVYYLNAPWVHTCGFYDNNLNYGGPGIWIWQSGGPVDYKIQFNYKGNSLASTPQPVGAWRHVAVVRNGTTIKIYVNGVLNATGPEGSVVPVYSFPARFGTMFYNGFSPPQYNGLIGKLDEFRIYNRALSDAEIIVLHASTLPVKLLSFTGVNKNNTVLLNWQTAYEQNSSHYSIERSTNGVDFSEVEKIAASGNASAGFSYSYNDILSASVKMHPAVFYRLKSVDTDGNYSYSQVVAIQLDKTGIQLLVSPNPARDWLQVQTGSRLSGNAVLTITDALGRALISKVLVLQTGTNSIPVNISLLGAGLYTAELTCKDEKFSKQFIKE